MNFLAIKQRQTGKNVHFISDDFQEHSLEEAIIMGEKDIFVNVKVVGKTPGRKYLRSIPNSNSSDNLDSIAITCNDGDYLFFDRKYLYLKALNGRVKLKWGAFSGNTEASSNDQAESDYGPLPEGEYIVRFEDTVDAEKSTGLLDALKWLAKFPSWGTVATPLEQISGETFGRSDFYIHGGVVKGTAGCIEIDGYDNKMFHAFMALYKRNFKLIVKYK